MKQLKKNVAIVSMLLSLSYFVDAQDPHFSQFFVSPLTLNPALTGRFDGAVRVAGNYHNQLPAFNNVYTTSTLSIDFNVLKNNPDTWGLGILLLKDQAGKGVITNNYLGFSTSYHKALDEDKLHQIGIGFQGIYGQKRLDKSKLFFEDQLTTAGFTGVTQDIFTGDNLNIKYTDISAGLLYSLSTTESNQFFIGASMYHINQPNESFKGGEWKAAQRTTISAGGYFPVSSILTLHTSGIYQMQQKATETVLGGALAANIDPASVNPTNVFAGVWLRLHDAVIPYVGLGCKGFRFGATYDINFSGLKSGSQSRGGSEFSLIYIKRAQEYKGIPCFKF